MVHSFSIELRLTGHITITKSLLISTWYLHAHVIKYQKGFEKRYGGGGGGISGLCSERGKHITLKIILLATEMALNPMHHSQFNVGSSLDSSLRKSIQLNNWSVWSQSMNMQEGDLPSFSCGSQQHIWAKEKETLIVQH